MNKYLVLLSLVLLLGCQRTSKGEVELFFERLSILTFKKSLINMNISNAQVTRTARGGAYVPKEAFECKLGICEVRALRCKKDCPPGEGKLGEYSPVLKYDPKHPDANLNGYVEYPHIDIKSEMSRLIKVSRAIDFLLESAPIKKSFFFSNQFKAILDKYPALKESYDFENI